MIIGTLGLLTLVLLKENKMKKLTLNILLLILLLTAAVWPVSADNGISYLSEDPNEPEPESI